MIVTFDDKRLLTTPRVVEMVDVDNFEECH